MLIDPAKHLVQSLLSPSSYSHEVKSEVQLIETHISWVFLAGDFAYKIKKPIKNNFLDYTTLGLRKHFCEEELRLNQRYANEIYIEVIVITSNDGQIRVGGIGEPIEYAVRMRRFANDALLSYRVTHDLVHLDEIRSFAAKVAELHSKAATSAPSSRFGSPELIYAEAIENFRDISASLAMSSLELNELLENWTIDYFRTHERLFQLRHQDGHIRECHGDLHLGNVTLWKERFLPFDGIEFCDDFRWIDTLSDAAFAAMDFAARGRVDLCHSFLNAYFEFSGDYQAVVLLQWYLVYRSMVRAKVAAIRCSQTSANAPERGAAKHELDAMLDLANRFTTWRTSKPQLWITYGVSGSGKSTGSEQVLQRHRAIRIRADVERKRLAGLQPQDRITDHCTAAAGLYSNEMTIATYQRLAALAEQLLHSHANVVVDATFLLKWQRDIFRDLALRMQVPFRILAFHADPPTLRQRVAQRLQENRDASDADLRVLEAQLKSQQHLEADELQFVAAVTD